MFECSNRTNDAAPIPGQATGYRVRAISGDPVYVYFGIVDVSRPYAVGVNGTGAITIEGTPGPTAPTLQQVTNADPATWTQLLTTEASFDTVVTADRTCTGGDLQATADPTTEAAMGHVLYVNRLTNIRDTACNLAGATRQRPRRTPQDERLQRQTRRPPHLAHPHTPDRRRHPHPQPTLSYWY